VRKIIIIVYIFLFSFPLICRVQAKDICNYLILDDIGNYKYITQTKNPLTKEIKKIPGYTIISGPGNLAATGHFCLDHADTTYEIEYESDITDIGVEIQVSQHAGSDSDKWLLHEVERGFRRGDYEEDMTSARFRNIDGNYIFYSGLGGGTYRWLNNNKVINIEYTDLYKQKSEPLEVINAYLEKFPSTINEIIIDAGHNEQWIKNEIDRRLWLCDKWFQHLSEGKTELYDTLKEVNDNLEVFLDYRKKYYEIDAFDEKKALSGYLVAKNEQAIRKKLEKYKEWWNKNKSKPIILK